MDIDTIHRMYVITSDQEEAIKAGLRLSQLQNLSIQFFCTLHIKWNVADHKCVVVTTHDRSINIDMFKNS